MYKTEVCWGRFQLWAGSQGVLVKLAPAETIKSHHLQVTKSATGYTPEVMMRLNNFGVKFATRRILFEIGVFVILGVSVSSCLVSFLDTPSEVMLVKHIPAFRSTLQNVIELIKEED